MTSSHPRARAPPASEARAEQQTGAVAFMSWRAAAPNPRDDASPLARADGRAPPPREGQRYLTRSEYCSAAMSGPTSPGSASLISIIQLACGSAFTFSGFSASAPLTAVTTPDTGL